ncbi:MAG TPA: carboxypeptidase-like regulatory domain-containing protein [Bryobacteraceae bacterium]
MRPRLLCAAVLAAFWIFPALAQTGAGSIQGAIKDATGAVVPKAHVMILRVDTGRQYETTSNSAGLYLFPAIEPGGYSMTVEVPGMQKWEGKFVLSTGQEFTVDVVLNVGSAASTVTVAGDVGSPVDTVSATLATVVEHQRIEELPLNGRSVATLVVQTAPGVDEGSGSTNRSATNLPRVNGLKWGAMEFTQDGAALMDRYWGFLQMRPPGLDTVQEFRVETNNSSAKYDHPATTIITTKNGTNQFHGSAFETLRNSGLATDRQRQDFFSKPPPLIRNEYGASIGGPVTIPHVYNGRNRTFFFASFEGYDLRQYTTVGTAVPTAAMLQGNFGGLQGSNGIPITIYDPASTGSAATNYTRTPFAGNMIPATRESAFAKYLFGIFPLPNLANVNPLVGNNLQWASPNNRDDRTGTIRLDQTISTKDQVFVRATYGVADTYATNDYNNAPITTNGATNFTTGHFLNPSFAASYTHVFSPTLFSEFLANYGVERWSQIAGDRSQNYAAQLGVPNPFNKTGFPEIRNTGFNGIDTGENANTEEDFTHIFSVDENMTKVLGKHEIQFGGRYHYEKVDDFPQQQFQVNLLYFNNLSTAIYDPNSGSSYAAQPNTGFDGAALYLGTGTYFSTLLNRNFYHFVTNEAAGYVQDNYKVNGRLTLYAGLRVEHFPIAHESNNLWTSWDPANKAMVLGQSVDKLYALGATTPGIINLYTSLGVKFESAQQAGIPSDLTRTDLFDFGPRAGFAYKVTTGRHPLVVRGGFSRFAFPIPGRYYVQRSRSNIPLSTRFTIDYSTAAQSPDGKANYALRNTPPFIVGQGTANLLDPNSPAPVSPGSFGITYFAPDLPSSRADEWNITFEREIFDNILARASYVGTHGFNLDQLYDTNQAPSSYVWENTTGTAVPTSGALAGVATRLYPALPYGTIEEFTKNGYSYYHGMTLSVEKRFSRGSAFQVFYVLSSATRLGGNGWYDSFEVDPNIFLPNSVPTNLNQLNRLLNYERDPEIPKHHLRWNWLVDLPFGRGKLLGRNANGFVNAFIGGWQFAGSGNMVSRYFALATTNWGPTNPIQVYGLNQPVQDCRSGTCYASYLFYNGYIPPTQINSVNAAGKCTGICGVPSNYQPNVTPINNTPGTQYYGTNTVQVKLANGTTQAVAYANGVNPLQNQYLPGPMLWTTNASLFKAFRVREGEYLRFNADFFNVLNQPGLNLPDAGTGVISKQNSAQAPRQLQLTLRFTW